MGTPLTHIDQVDPQVVALAERDAHMLGIGFIVYGRHVSPDDVFVLSPGNASNPIALMRRLKQECQALLDEVKAIEQGTPFADTRRLDHLDKMREAYGFAEIHEGNRWSIEGPFANVRLALDADGALAGT